MNRQDKRWWIKECFEKIIFFSRWFLIPFYLKLFWTLSRLLYTFWTGHVETHHVISVLEDVDVVMIANLIKMIITGSYTSFVDKFHGEEKDKTSAGMLKVKMAGSLVGVSSIFLLKKFLEDTNMTGNELTVLLSIHGSFLVGVIVLSVADYLHCKADHNAQ